jgi:hypothetical protein
LRGALRVLRAEAARLGASRAAQAAAALLVLVPALRVAVSTAGRELEALEAEAKGVVRMGLDAGTAWAPFVEAWRTGMVLGLTLLLVQAARSVAGDRESGVMRIAVTRSASRSGALTGRALMGPLMVIAIVVLSGLGALGAASFTGTFGDLVEDGDVIRSSGEVLEELRRSVGTAVLGLVSVHAFGVLMGTLVRGAVMSLAASLASLLVWDVFKGSLGPNRWWFFPSHAPTFIDGSAMSELRGFAEGYSDKGLAEQIFRQGLILPPVWSLVMVALAVLLLRRRAL